MIEGNTEKFTGKADVYKAARPGYPKKLLDYLYYDVGFSAKSVIADVGSGTGKFTQELLKRGSTVYAVEPNDDMREAAERDLAVYPNFISIKGTSDFTGLDERSVDFITAAQAFHWFDADKFKAECKRILKPGGSIALLWNTRMECEFNTKNRNILMKHCPGFMGFSSEERDKASVVKFFDGDFIQKEFDNTVCMSKSMFIARCQSASYSIQNSAPNYKEYISDLENLFDEYAINGKTEIMNKTVVYVRRIK